MQKMHFATRRLMLLQLLCGRPTAGAPVVAYFRHQLRRAGRCRSPQYRRWRARRSPRLPRRHFAAAVADTVAIARRPSAGVFAECATIVASCSFGSRRAKMQPARPVGIRWPFNVRRCQRRHSHFRTSPPSRDSGRADVLVAAAPEASRITKIMGYDMERRLH